MGRDGHFMPNVRYIPIKFVCPTKYLKILLALVNSLWHTGFVVRFADLPSRLDSRNHLATPINPNFPQEERYEDSKARYY